MKRLNKNTLFLVLLGLFAAFLLANLCSVSFFRRGDPGTDSSVFRYTAYAVTNGQILYKDVFDHKGPLMCLINVIGLLLHPELGVWALEFLALFTAVCFLYKTVRLVCGHPLPSLIAVFFALSPLTTSLQGGNLVEEFALPLIAAALYIFTEYFTSGVTPPGGKSWSAASAGVVC